MSHCSVCSAFEPLTARNTQQRSIATPQELLSSDLRPSASFSWHVPSAFVHAHIPSSAEYNCNNTGSRIHRFNCSLIFNRLHFADFSTSQYLELYQILDLKNGSSNPAGLKLVKLARLQFSARKLARWACIVPP